jgi:hypothetical protein
MRGIAGIYAYGGTRFRAWLVREGMAAILPDEVRLRRDKQGLVAPTERWFRSARTPSTAVAAAR